MRSLLFVPGDSEKKLAKASSSGADAIIVDLEDSVATPRKKTARNTTAAYLRDATDSSFALCVRINGLDTNAWRHDLDAIADTPPAYVLLPKARGGSDVQALTSALAERGLTEMRIIVLVTEIPVSLLRLDTYIDSSSALSALTWGAEDLSVELGAFQNRDDKGQFTAPYQLARNLTLIAAAAAGVEAIDTVFTNFRDTRGLEREAVMAARDGFTGKLAIHPAQIEPINAAFTPTEHQCRDAQAILDAYGNAGTDVGVLNLDGKMIDEPHRRQAERLIARSKKYSG